jgi:hypothetical protein
MTQNTPDTFLVHVNDGYLEYYIGTEDEVNRFAAGEGGNLTPAPKIGTKRQWDNHMNGGPNPLAVWLKAHPEIKKIVDQDYPDPFGATETWDVADWIEQADN